MQRFHVVYQEASHQSLVLSLYTLSPKGSKNKWLVEYSLKFLSKALRDLYLFVQKDLKALLLKARLRRSHGMLSLCASSWGLARWIEAFFWGLSPVIQWSYAIGQCYISFKLHNRCFLFQIESFIFSSCMTELRKYFTSSLWCTKWLAIKTYIGAISCLRNLENKQKNDLNEQKCALVVQHGRCFCSCIKLNWIIVPLSSTFDCYFHCYYRSSFP